MGQGREPGGAPQIGLRVGGADLDRAEGRVQPRVPPDVGVVLQARRGADISRHPPEVLEIAELGRHRVAGVAAEDDRAGAGQAGIVAEPEGRVRRQRVQEGHVCADPVVGVERGLGVGHADVDVLAADRRAQHALEVPLDRPVAGGRVDLGVARANVGMDPDSHQPGPGFDQLRSDRAQVGDRFACVPGDLGVRLDHALEQLADHLALLRVSIPDDLPGLLHKAAIVIDEQHLLLHPEGERGLYAEVRLQPPADPSAAACSPREFLFRWTAIRRPTDRSAARGRSAPTGLDAAPSYP